MKNDIKRILREVIEDFINEEMSVNNDLEFGVENAVSEIIEKYRNTDIIDEKQVSLKYGNENMIYIIPIETLFCEIKINNICKLPCEINIYEFQDEETFNKLYSAIEFESNFNKRTKRMEINTYSIQKALNRLHLRNLIYHECEHSFQYFMSNETLIPNDNYMKVKNIIQGKDQYHNTELYVKIAWILYYYDKLEIDANINSLYGELMTDKSITLDSTNFNQNNAEIIKEFNDIIQYLGDEELHDVLKYFNFNERQFVKYITKQQKYIKEKTRKVVQRAIDKRKSLVENIEKITNTLRKKPIFFS